MRNIGLKYFVLSVIIMMMAGVLSSCEEHGAHIETPSTGGMNVKDEILFDGNTSQTLNIRASVKPKLICEASWLKIGEVKNLSTGIYTTELTAEVNTTGERRSTCIQVSAGKESSIVTVTQTFSDIIEVKGIDPEGDLDPGGGVFTLQYVATGVPAANLPEWIHQSDSRAITDGTLTFSYSANNTGKEREGMIVLAVGKGAVANVAVRQPAR